MKRSIEIEGLINSIVLVVMLSIVFINVLSRYALHLSFSFAEEVVCVLFVVLTTVGSAAAAKDESHFTLDLLTSAMSPKVCNRMQVINNFLSLTAAGILVVTGGIMVVQQYIMGSTSDSLRFPEWIYGLSIPIGCSLMAIRFSQVIIRRTKVWKDGELK